MTVCKAVLLSGMALILAGCTANPNHTSVRFRHTGATACMRIDQAVHTGSAGDWAVASSALDAARSMVRIKRDQQVLELVEGYYRLAELERNCREAVPEQLRAQVLDCREHWLRAYFEYFDPVKPPAGDNACVRAPQPGMSQHAM